MSSEPVDRPTVDEIARQWDIIADTRFRQITSGIDTSHQQILLPAVLESLRPGIRVLDVGCGIGSLSAAVASFAAEVVAIDPSFRSIDIARKGFGRPNLQYKISSIEDFAYFNAKKFDAVFSNMVLMDVANLDDVLAAARILSLPSAKFVATLTHPCFWPKYSGYETSSWFNYSQETFIRAPFRISSEVVDIDTIHVHRPLGMYCASLRSNGFENIQLTELYGRGAFSYPRFLRLVAEVE